MHRLSPELLIFLRKVATGEQRAKACSCLRRLHSLYRISLPTKKPPLPKLLSRRASQQADDPNWISLVDEPQQLVRVRHNKGNKWGLAILALIPITAFALGSWQVKRLAWKNDLIARFEDRLIRPPLPLPPTIDPDVVNEFDYRRVNVWGRLRHDQEILVGPRIHDGADGYQVITPLERDDEPEGGSKILISRGWIGKDMKSQDVRRKLSPDALPQHRIKVQGLLREPFKKNMFTPDNNPAKGEWYFPDVAQMAVHTGSQPVWIEETTREQMAPKMIRGTIRI